MINNAMMEMINLFCPGCKSHLTLPADKSDNENLTLVCPKCHFSGKPKSFIKINEKISDPTVIVSQNEQMALAIGRLKEVESSKIHPLHQGLNHFGRKSNNSNIEHQFSNNDTFISRKHFEINVVFNKVTLNYDHRLQDLGSVNGTKINDRKLSKGDIVLLKTGDRLLVGKTEIVFEIAILPDDTLLVRFSQ